MWPSLNVALASQQIDGIDGLDNLNNDLQDLQDKINNELDDINVRMGAWGEHRGGEAGELKRRARRAFGRWLPLCSGSQVTCRQGVECSRNGALQHRNLSSPPTVPAALSNTHTPQCFSTSRAAGAEGWQPATWIPVCWTLAFRAHDPLATGTSSRQMAITRTLSWLLAALAVRVQTGLNSNFTCDGDYTWITLDSAMASQLGGLKDSGKTLMPCNASAMLDLCHNRPV